MEHRNGGRHTSAFCPRAGGRSVDRSGTDGESRDDVFVYHLDDDTAVGRDTVASVAEFVANDTGRFHAAQGVLAFPRELATSRCCWLADAVRPADDLA